MNWTKFLIDSSKISAIYSDKLPLLESTVLHDVVLSRDGPKLILRLDLFEFPESPPQKWVKLGFNRVQIQLTALNIQNLKIEGLGTECMCNISIHSENKVLFIKILGEEIKIEFTSEFLILNKISAYLDNGKNTGHP
ncbi:Imm50 family immunity protein [Psychromonas algicola]|uniref:Imm50 family immunity protein n=1 Tax=Psychromonas algicola TaxID=2555642 RepID=UPI00106898FC|nr:Imm50 family immunity protein [Psychromonas sp. RZ5]TEW43037.1 hypothetical protein E2R67_16160 [Psychromonas sp. RZ5]